jgi:hypothetical protein
MFENLNIIPKERRYKVKVKVINSAGFVLDFDSTRGADQQLKPDWRDIAIVAYGKDKLRKTWNICSIRRRIAIREK